MKSTPAINPTDDTGGTRLPWLIYLSLCLLLAASIVVELSTSHQREIRGAEERTHATTALVGEWLTGAFQASDVLLHTLINDMAPEWLAPPPDQEGEARHRVGHLISRQPQLLPDIQDITVLDAQGRLLHGAAAGGTQATFIQFQDHPHLDHQVSGMFWSDRLGGFVVAQARAIRNRQGELTGMVSAHREVAFFHQQLERIERLPGSSLTLIDNELKVLARHPVPMDRYQDGVQGMILDTSVLNRLTDSPDTHISFTLSSPVDGITRVYTASKINGLPMIVIAGESRQQVLTAWWRSVTILGLTWLLVVGVGWVYLRGHLRNVRYERALRLSNRSLAVANQTLNQEIDERRRAEADLRTSEARFRQLFDHSLSGVAVHEILLNEDGKPYDYRFVLVNPAFETHTGIAAQDIVGKTALTMFPFPETLRLVDIFGEVALQGRTMTFEHGFRQSGKHFSVGAFPIETGRFAAIFDNITERKLTEARLRGSEEKYRFLIENSHDIIYLFTPDGRFAFVSPSWKTLLGHDIETVIGRHYSDFVHPDDLQICNRAFDQVMQRGNTHNDIEYRVRHMDGTWRWHNSSARPFLDEQGHISGFQGIARDITTRKAAEEEIRHLAFCDPLTQLPNRRQFIDRLERADLTPPHARRHAALLFIDLDDFKQINDTLGHDQGDQVLRETSQRIRRCLREEDMVARLGGDEFVVMLEGMSRDRATAVAQAGQVGEKILRAVAQPHVLAYGEYQLTASIGIALLDGQQGSGKDMIQHADFAMYQAKHAGKNALCFFDPQPKALTPDRTDDTPLFHP
ncbi:PAS domain S-box-containing protein/diguanylate cyclase (GGDEF) domain-containing protein [Ectothiorhodospira magna]|uniref:PAS domain S-box-containing protein/diguanylate cyclase (GGDEF) domain-containing protein n=1 Tax=Ectothiorhodospira magna TaxID=867345 RepID=A0A1H9EFS5_9GAMM|nr:diguanylate cyclase [Ectothiorhodospira magna]SEQ24432.1 PAS domain S-box-containing protein/diguanylate cyclase (GGDEF) domain-containing protein [Ectothiorhodospira magna]